VVADSVSRRITVEARFVRGGIIDCIWYLEAMASITIRRLEDSTKERLRVRASRHGRSMEEEAREILKSALGKGRESSGNLAEDIRRLFGPLGGVDLRIPRRGPMREPPDFGE